MLPQTIVLAAVKHLDPSKTTSFMNIPIKILKENTDICLHILTKLINYSIINSKFPIDLKMADVSPVFKKEDACNKENYRAVSLLPTVYKIYENILATQINDYIDNYFSDYLCGFRKGHSSQHCLLVMFENMTKSIDSKGAACALLTDLSKAFDCLKYDLLIAKLHAYGFSHSSLQLVFDYLSNRKQRVKIDATFSEWTEVNTGVPQGSIIGPLLFNIFINDIFYFVKDTKITNYADDNTPYKCGTDIDNILGQLENEGNILIKWFSNNYMKANADKCHLLVTNNA